MGYEFTKGVDKVVQELQGMLSCDHVGDNIGYWAGGERERLFGSREREGKLKITFPFYGKGTGIRKCYGKGREWEI